MVVAFFKGWMMKLLIMTVIFASSMVGAMELEQKEKEKTGENTVIEVQDIKPTVRSRSATRDRDFVLNLEHTDCTQEIEELAEVTLKCVFGEGHKADCIKPYLKNKIKKMQSSPEKKDSLNSLREFSARQKNNIIKKGSEESSEDSAVPISPHIQKAINKSLVQYNESNFKYKVIIGMIGFGTAVVGVIATYLSSHSKC